VAVTGMCLRIVHEVPVYNRPFFCDLTECVSKYVATALLPGWLRNMKGDYMALLHALDVENSTETPILALKTLFKLV
jgi:hypothetical protein